MTTDSLLPLTDASLATLRDSFRVSKSPRKKRRRGTEERGGKKRTIKRGNTFRIGSKSDKCLEVSISLRAPSNVHRYETGRQHYHKALICHTGRGGGCLLESGVSVSAEIEETTGKRGEQDREREESWKSREEGPRGTELDNVRLRRREAKDTSIRQFFTLSGSSISVSGERVSFQHAAIQIYIRRCGVSREMK